MLLPGGRNEESESENVCWIASLVTEEVRHTWQGQRQTKMSKDWAGGPQNSKEKMVLRLSQEQRVRQVEDKVSLLWQALSFLLLSCDFKVYPNYTTHSSQFLTRLLSTLLQSLIPQPYPRPLSFLRIATYLTSLRNSNVSNNFQPSPIPFCLPPNLFFLFTKT